MTNIEKIASGLTKAQREAFMQRDAPECRYGHPQGTRCPNCSAWPYAKGEALAFTHDLRAHLLTQEQPR